tara:strand:+ start:486 stop:977 length:492 start_codon:yes stop_codon:yes gene_type:complete
MAINFPEGAQDYPSIIIQCVTTNYYINTEVQISSNSWYNFNTISITPKSNNSRLFFMSTPFMFSRSHDRNNNNYSNTDMYVQDITNTADVKCQTWLNYADDQGGSSNSATDGYRQQYPVWAEFSNTVTSQRQFRTRAYSNGNNTKGRIGGDFRMHQIIWEMDN